MIVSGPISLLVHEVFGYSFPIGREIGINQRRLQKGVRLAGGDVDDVGKGLAGARFGGEFIEDAGGIGPVVLRLDKWIALVKFSQQRRQLIDGGEAIDYDLAFFLRALAESLLPFLTLQPFEWLED